MFYIRAVNLSWPREFRRMVVRRAGSLLSKGSRYREDLLRGLSTLVIRQLIQLTPVSTRMSPVSHATAFQPHHEYSDIRWRHPRDTGCLAKRRGPNLQKLLPRLGSQAWDFPVVEAVGDLFILQIPELGDFVFLAGNIAGILDGDLNF